MKRLLSVAVVLALAAARPETYKENEDFNYSRSSTDEGSKSGSYNAQRGNMGGNYERAHNMDGLAQHQMSTAVKQVEGELGEASNMRSGQVYTSAHSGGMFGSGHYDVSNLQGRNFQENAASESQSHSSLSSYHSNYNDQLSSSMHNSGFSHNHGYGQYQGSKAGVQSLTSSNLQAIDNVHDASYGYGTHGAGQLTSSNLQATDNVHGANYGSGTHGTINSHSSGYSSQSGYESHRAYDSSNTNQQTHSGYGTIPQNRMIYTAPVRVYVRPGSREAIPVAVQNYDATHSASMVDQNSINSEAEVLNAGDQHVVYRPTSNAKHYESSYNYRKQWEKHDVKPEVIALSLPTESTLPQNSELYEDTQSANAHHHTSGLNSQNHYSSSSQNAYNTKSSSATQSHNMASVASSDAHTHGDYSSGNSADATNTLGGIDTKPKSYQSSYSYHKSWERQGDPYVIKPVGGAYTEQELQRLTAASQQTGSNYHQTHQGYSNGNGLVCCDASGYRRVARSARGDDLTQQSQTNWGDIEDLRQQTENSWDRSDALRLAQFQQAQVQYAKVQQIQEPKWENLEELGQRTQNSWDSSDAHRQAQNQQTQKNENDFGQQVQQNAWANKEDLTQQVQQNTRDNSQDLTQQTQQHKWNNAEHVAHGQRHLDQDVLNAWPEISYPEQNENQAQESTNRPGSSETEQKHVSEFQDEEKMTRPSSSDFNLEHRQSNMWSNQEQEGQSNIWSNQEQQSQSNIWPSQEQQSQSQIWSNQEQQSQSNIRPNQEQQSESNIWSNQKQSPYNIWSNQEQQSESDIWSNQEQQSQSNIWSNQAMSQSNIWSNQEQQEMQPSSLRSHGQEEIDQHGNKSSGISQYLDQHKYSNQQEKDILAPAPLSPSWLSIDKQGNSFLNESSSYDEVQQHSVTESFGIYDWSQVSANKNDTDISQSSSLLDKINELDRQLSAYNNDLNMGEENKNNHFNLNAGKYNGNQHNIMSANTTVKPQKADKATIDIPKITENSRVNKIKENNQDIGRGDIGPEEDFVGQNVDIQTLNESIPISLTKENNISFSIDDNNNQQVSNNQQLLNQWFEEERKNYKIYNLNSTADTSQHSSLEQKYYQSGSSSKNQTNLYQGYQNVIMSARGETQSNKHKNIQSSTYKNNDTDTKESTSQMAVETQQIIPSSQLKKTSTNNIPEKSSEKIKSENNIRFSEFGQMDTQQRQHQFVIDEVKLEPINQNIDQQWQQTDKFNDNETVWGQSLKSFLQMPQKQDKAETFGVRVKDDNQRTEILLAEKIKRDPENLDDVYQSNYNLPHYTKQFNQKPAQLQTSNNNMQDTQTPQMVNTEVFIEPTTSKPGFWKSAKNKFVSWFKKS